MKLTDKEKAVLIASTSTEHGDARECSVWSWAVQEGPGLDEKIFRGVFSSLIKKGLAKQRDNEGKGEYRDSCFDLLPTGITETNKLISKNNT